MSFSKNRKPVFNLSMIVLLFSAKDNIFLSGLLFLIGLFMLIAPKTASMYFWCFHEEDANPISILWQCRAIGFLYSFMAFISYSSKLNL